jgi:hypothetical protein
VHRGGVAGVADLADDLVRCAGVRLLRRVQFAVLLGERRRAFGCLPAGVALVAGVLVGGNLLRHDDDRGLLVGVTGQGGDVGPLGYFTGSGGVVEDLPQGMIFEEQVACSARHVGCLLV